MVGVVIISFLKIMVIVVDDERLVRQALEGLLKSANFRLVAFSSAEDEEAKEALP